MINYNNPADVLSEWHKLHIGEHKSLFEKRQPNYIRRFVLCVHAMTLLGYGHFPL